MNAFGLGRWEPFDVQQVMATFAEAPYRWWISGGYALELHLQRSWRSHDDIDVGIRRSDLALVGAYLSGWDVHVAAAGVLTPWTGQDLTTDRHENNLWCRATPGGPWLVDIAIGEGTEQDWVYRRDSAITRPWETAVLSSDSGVRYLAPELQLLYKSKGRRRKDDQDAREVIPRLSARERELLSGALDAQHPWQSLLQLS